MQKKYDKEQIKYIRWFNIFCKLTSLGFLVFGSLTLVEFSLIWILLIVMNINARVSGFYDE